MNQNDRGFSVAFATAQLSDAPRAGLRMGSALYAGSRLLAVGANRWHSHPASDNQGFCRSLHAEHVALLRRQHFDKPSGRLTMFIARRLADGTIGSSRPCANCLRLLREAGISVVWFYENGVRKEITP